MKLYIKNMFSPSGISDVKTILQGLHILYEFVDLGEVDLADNTPKKKIKELNTALELQGMEIITEKKMILIERIKTLIIKMIRFTDELPIENYSVYISEKLQHNYTYLANLFSATEKITIEHFIIKHKIEKVKELILSDQFNITEIASNMHYSSAAHLANQFKKVTGQTTTNYKRQLF